jgi:hypothetical protein
MVQNNAGESDGKSWPKDFGVPRMILATGQLSRQGSVAPSPGIDGHLTDDGLMIG